MDSGLEGAREPRLGAAITIGRGRGVGGMATTLVLMGNSSKSLTFLSLSFHLCKMKLLGKRWWQKALPALKFFDL